jgi:hypothetical protein
MLSHSIQLVPPRNEGGTSEEDAIAARLFYSWREDSDSSMSEERGLEQESEGHKSIAIKSSNTAPTWRQPDRRSSIAALDLSNASEERS